MYYVLFILVLFKKTQSSIEIGVIVLKKRKIPLKSM